MAPNWSRNRRTCIRPVNSSSSDNSVRVSISHSQSEFMPSEGKFTQPMHRKPQTKEKGKDPLIDCSSTDSETQDSSLAPEGTRRNLSEAFEELFVTPKDASSGTPNVKLIDLASADEPANLVSPTGVADVCIPTRPSNDQVDGGGKQLEEAFDDTKRSDDCLPVPFFSLHAGLKRELSQAVVNRVSFYNIIHDINKEATAMAANDDLAMARSPEEQEEDRSALVVAVNGPPRNVHIEGAISPDSALIDEERWLLAAIEARGDDEERQVQPCPPTFLQAMGEREYENPLTLISSASRTQLWKPSRSWWEAKSGKNPWIEPKSHNKRWRYLWPLIHYHKFLAKCIKKLKRNGVDVKLAVSPVAAFLREEVCAVSDHLAAVSLFDSEKWMECLDHFHGWIDTREESENRLRHLISQLSLRPIREPGDVDSPLLRSQIDEQFLRAMVATRTQLEIDLPVQPERRKQSRPSSKVNKEAPPKQKDPRMQSHGNASMYTRNNQGVPYNTGTPLVPGSGASRPRYGFPYENGPWWNQNWDHPSPYHLPYGDEASIPSSNENFSDAGMYCGAPHGHFYPPSYYSPSSDFSNVSGIYDAGMPVRAGGYDPSMGEHARYPVVDPYDPENFQAYAGWVGHPTYGPFIPYGVYGHAEIPGFLRTKHPSPEKTADFENEVDGTPKEDRGETECLETETTPSKHDVGTQPSPYWSHLDRTTLALGLATPSAVTPKSQTSETEKEEREIDSHVHIAESTHGIQPLLLRKMSNSHCYGYGPQYGPPSPATQFMMSPQGNFAFVQNYGVTAWDQNCQVLPHLSQKTPPKVGKDDSVAGSGNPSENIDREGEHA